jgi:hypothetical protein
LNVSSHDTRAADDEEHTDGGGGGERNVHVEVVDEIS